MEELSRRQRCSLSAAEKANLQQNNLCNVLNTDTFSNIARQIDIGLIFYADLSFLESWVDTI